MNKQSLTLLIGVVIVAIIIAVIAPRMSQDAQNNNDATDTSMVSDIDQPVETTNYAYLLKSEWPYSEQAEEDIQVLGEGQVISNGIVQDPTDRSYYYFASNTIDTEAQTNLVSVYKYNSDDYTFERVYKMTADNEEENPFLGNNLVWLYTVTGYHNGYLELTETIGDAADDKCGGYHVPQPGRDHFGLNLEDPYEGLNRDIPYADEEEQDRDRQRWINCKDAE